MRNCTRSGQLLKFKNVQEFKSKKRPLWIQLSLVLFKENGEFFPCFVCSHCESMKAVSTLKIDQEKSEIEKFECYDSCFTILPDLVVTHLHPSPSLFWFVGLFFLTVVLTMMDGRLTAAWVAASTASVWSLTVWVEATAAAENPLKGGEPVEEPVG